MTRSNPDNLGTTKRPNRQQVAAAATKRDILLVARRLFAERGYHRTSIADIADAAGVSIPTIYASIGPKPEIVLALVDFEDAEIGGVDARDQVANLTAPEELVALAAHTTRLVQERLGELRRTIQSAAEVEPRVAKALARSEELHQLGSQRIAQRLTELGSIRQGVSAQEAAAVISLLTDSETYARLVDRHGWTLDQAEVWIADSLRTLLLRQA